MDEIADNEDEIGTVLYPHIHPLIYPRQDHRVRAMNRLHLHMLSDSTGETLENIAKAAL
ncbi:Phosphoenolpyruvate synthase regulatory protein, partial [hydrothermal vent metagenome]